MITLTHNAATAVKAAISRSPDAMEGMRIRIEEGGCAGFKYTMQLEATALADDLVLEQEGVKLFIDGRSQQMVQGMQIDFVTSLHASGFVFENPNASNQCGCGKSFS
jgi:iron-sulfur cluster assembly accessory protein